MIDSVILAFVWIIFSIASGQNSAFSAGLPSYPALSALAFLAFIYYFVQEWLFSATVGKSIVKLRIVDGNGDDCSFGASFKRNALRFVDWLPILYLVGAIAIMASVERQRVGDRLAGTFVTSRPEKDPNPPPAPFLFH